MTRNWVFASFGAAALTIGVNGFVRANEGSPVPIIEPAPAPALQDNTPQENRPPASQPKKSTIRIEPMQRQTPSMRMVVDNRPGLTYSDAYNQIPFHRAEYEANPGYRHDAAMELLFGQLRPTTIGRQSMPRAFRYSKPSIQYLPPAFSPPFGWGGFGFGGFGPNVGNPFFDPSVAW
jgi:hypothetical protein